MANMKLSNGSDIKSTQSSKRDINSFAGEINLDKIYLGGEAVKDLMNEFKFKENDFEAYLPADIEKVHEKGVEFHYLGYFVKWHPQDIYYYSVLESNFKPNDFRTEGSYSKYSSLDDKIDWLHYYARYVNLVREGQQMTQPKRLEMEILPEMKV